MMLIIPLSLATSGIVTVVLFIPDNEKMFRIAKNKPSVSISKAQREPRLGLNYLTTLYSTCVYYEVH